MRLGWRDGGRNLQWWPFECWRGRWHGHWWRGRRHRLWCKLQRARQDCDRGIRTTRLGDMGRLPDSRFAASFQNRCHWRGTHGRHRRGHSLRLRVRHRPPRADRWLRWHGTTIRHVRRVRQGRLAGIGGPYLGRNLRSWIFHGSTFGRLGHVERSSDRPELVRRRCRHDCAGPENSDQDWPHVAFSSPWRRQWRACAGEARTRPIDARGGLLEGYVARMRRGGIPARQIFFHRRVRAPIEARVQSPVCHITPAS